MRASVGDRVVVAGRHLGAPERDAEVLEVHGTHGEPPFVVRWTDDGHVATYVPGSDARVEHHDITIETIPADAGRREVIDGIAALRVEAARLRAALAQSRDSGSATWQTIGDELTKGLARFESETAVLWAHLRTAEAESVDAVTTALEDAVRAVRTTLDGLRVQARLARAEAEDSWQNAADVLRRLRTNAPTHLDTAKAAANAALVHLRPAVDRACESQD